MLKMEHSIDYLKKGKSGSEILEEAQRVKQPNLRASAQQPSTQHKRTGTDSKEDESEDGNPKRTRTSSPDHQHVEVDVEPGTDSKEDESEDGNPKRTRTSSPDHQHVEVDVEPGTGSKEDESEDGNPKRTRTYSPDHQHVEVDVEPGTGSKEDESEDGNPKRTRTYSPDHQHVEVDVEPRSGLSSPKRQKLSTSSHSQHSSDVENPENLDRERKGLLPFYHGIAYQVQWMMVVALEAQERLKISKLKESEKTSAFKFKTVDIKTEDSDSGKFDDLVWRYETSQPNPYEWNFLQAKHKLNTEEKITRGDLLQLKQNEGSSRSNEKDKRPFALEKYFLSYRDEIKKNYDGEINKLIIATNIDFDDDLRSRSFEPLQDNIPVLNFMEEGANKEPKKCWRIKKGDSSLKNEVIKQLESTYDSIKLIEELLECVSKNEAVTEESSLGAYFYELVENKVIHESGKFHPSFINNDKLPDKAKSFRDFLLELGFKNKKGNSSSDFILPDPKGIAKIIASQIKKSLEKEVKITRMGKKGETVNANIDKLANYVLVEDEQNKVRFSRVFWEDTNLPGNLSQLRDSLKDEFIKSVIIDQSDNGSQIYKKLRQYHFKITGKDKYTGEEFTTCKERLVSEKAFWEDMGRFDKFEINLEQIKMIELAKDSKDLSSESIILEGKKFSESFKKGKEDDLSDKAKKFRKFLLKLGFKNKENSNSDFMIQKKLPDPKGIAKIIATQIKKSPEKEVKITRMGKEGKTVNANIDKLANYVLVEDEQNKVRFSRVFWVNKELSDDIRLLRDSLKDEFIKSVIIDQSDNGSQIYEKLRQYHFTITGKDKGTGKGFTTCKERLISEKAFWEDMENGSIESNIIKILPYKNFPEKSLREIKDEIEEFFERLTFVVSYPQRTLDEFIKKKCSWFVGIETDYIAYEFQAKIANALNLETKKFISKAEDVSQFFVDAKEQIDELILIGPTLEYRAKIKEFGIAFSKEPSGLNHFLVSQKINSSTKKVFNLVNPHKTILSSIKVYQTLKDILEYQKDGSHIFVRLSSLLRIKDGVIKAFESRLSCKLLVIECKAAEEKMESIMVQKLLDVTRSSVNKKIILITLENDPTAGQFKDRDIYEEKIYEKVIDERNRLTDLTVESQKELLQKKQVTFQGEEVSLAKLIDQKSKHIIDAETLSKLINNKKIEIGIKRPDLSDLESIYYVTSVEMEQECFQQAMESNLDDLFVINGITKSEFENEFSQLLSKLYSQQKKAICLLEQNIPSIEEETSIILTDKDEEKNLADFKQICSFYHKKIVDNDLKRRFAIHLIEKNNNKLVWKRSYDPSFYIPRELYYVIIEKNSLKKYVEKEPEKTSKKKDIFAVSGIDKKELKNEYEIDAFEEGNLSTDDSSSKKNHVIVLEDREGSFKKLCSKDKIKDFYNIHWLQNKRDKESNHLVWKRSEGEINKIRGLKSENSKFLIDKDDLNTIINTEKAIVIADEPGMGKSTTLTHLLSQPLKSDWVIKLNLINFQKQLGNLPVDVISKERIKDFFSEVDAGVKDGLAKDLLEHRLYVKGDVTLLFDGFDEISYENQGKFIKLLKFLRDTKAKIQVTTRLCAKDWLENTLSVLPYTFQPFLKSNQEEFLRTFWNASLKMVPDKDKVDDAVCKGIDDIFEPFYKNINDKYKLMSTPLLIRMFAEVYQKTIENFCSHKNQVETETLGKEVNKLSILDLYERFIEKKYDIYFKEKMKIEVNPGYVKDKLTKALDKDHQRLAFDKLFPSYSEQLVDKQKFLSHEQEKDLKLVGVIQSINNEDSHYFIHKTFAEYFSAGLLADVVGRQENNPKRQLACKFLCEHLFKQESRIMRNFFDHMLAKDNVEETRYEIHNAVLNNDKDKVQELLKEENIINSLDKGGRTVVHLAAAYGYEEIVQDLLEHSAGVEIVVDNIFGWKSINYARVAGEWDVAKKILEKANFFGDNLNKELVKEFRMLPREIAEGLCETGKYEGTYGFNEKALKSLRTVLGEKHLEVAIMLRYLGNALGDRKEHSEKKKNLKMALEVLKEHCEVAKGEKNPELQEDYFQQALSSFKKGFESVKGQGADKEKETWKSVLDIEIAKVKRNLGNVYGELAEDNDNETEKKEQFEEKKKLLKDALDIFKKYELEIYIAKTKRNLGNVYGELAEGTEDNKEKKELFEKKKKLLEDALVIFEKRLGCAKKKDPDIQAYSSSENEVKGEDDGSLDEVWERLLKIDIGKTKRNLGNVYGKLAKSTEDKEEEFFELKVKFLEEALNIFKRYNLELDIAKTKWNLGKAYGKKGNHQEKKKLHEEALPVLKKLNVKIT